MASLIEVLSRYLLILVFITFNSGSVLMFQYQLETQTTEPSNSAGKYLTAFQRKLLQKSLQEDGLDSYRQRIEIMLLADEGKTQAEVCQMLGCCAATARHWMHIARSGMAHQWQDCPIGRPKTVNDQYLERLREMVNSNPRDYGYSFRRWTANWLQKHLAKELGIEVSDRHLKRLLKQMGLSTKIKPHKSEEKRIKSEKENKIFIKDLNSPNIQENTDFLPINLPKLAKNLDIYGAQSIRSIAVFTTVEQYFGLHSYQRGVSALSDRS
jgi:transposase